MSDSVGKDAYFIIRSALEALNKVTDNSHGSRTACPIHGGTDTDNFTLYPSGVGRCWSECNRKYSPSDLASFLGVEITITRGVTVEKFVSEFSLPSNISDDFGLRDSSYRDRPCVLIPYLDEDGNLLREQRRLTLHSGQEGQRFNWKGSGGTSFLFGLHRLEQIRQANSCLIVEGVSDVLCATAAKVPALGVPGSGAWKSEYSEYLEGVRNIAVWREPGDAGTKFTEAVAVDIPDVKVFSHDIAKDPAELYRLVGAESFKSEIEAMWNSSPQASQLLNDEREKELGELHAAIGGLLADTGLAERIEHAITSGGFVGDVRPAMVVYMTVTGRLLNKPPHLKLLGQAGSGKNAAIDAALRLFPKSAYFEIDAASGAFLIYNRESLKHRAVILTEMDSMPRSDTNFASFLRSLMDKGHAEYKVTVEGKQGENRKGTSVSVEGPIAFITTGIRDLDSQAHSRMLTQPINDDPARIKAVTKMQARRRSGDIEKIDVSKYQALQRYLELKGPYLISVPFWTTVVDLMPDALFNNVRQNRDADQLLAFIESYAVMYQAQRRRDGRNRIVAEVEDYRRAAALLDPLFRLASADGVTESDRQAYGAVERLQASNPAGASNAALADDLGLVRSTISGRVTRMQRKGLLKDLSQKKHERLWNVDSPLPEASGLPSADRVERALAEASMDNPPNTRTLSPTWPVPAEVFEGSPPYPRAGLAPAGDDDVVSF